MLRAFFIKEITIIDNNEQVKLSIYRRVNGGIFAIDNSFLLTGDTVFCPFKGKEIELIDEKELFNEL